jgi:hypothetical protein
MPIAVMLSFASMPALATCPADLDGDQVVGGADLSILLGNWDGTGDGDLNGDGFVGGGDLAGMLAAWGACPPSGPFEVELAAVPIAGLRRGARRRRERAALGT